MRIHHTPSHRDQKLDKTQTKHIQIFPTTTTTLGQQKHNILHMYTDWTGQTQTKHIQIFPETTTTKTQYSAYVHLLDWTKQEQNKYKSSQKQQY